MPDTFTTYWPADVCEAAGAVVREERPLEVLYGGPHQSRPSFATAKVSPGDVIYPVTVRRRVLYVLARMTVREIIHLSPPERVGRLLAGYSRRFPAWRFLYGGCIDEVVLGGQGTPVRLDIPVPGNVVQQLAYRSQQATRQLKHVTEEGELTSAASLQGIYRLTEQSALHLSDALAAAPTPWP